MTQILKILFSFHILQEDCSLELSRCIECFFFLMANKWKKKMKTVKCIQVSVMGFWFFYTEKFLDFLGCLDYDWSLLFGMFNQLVKDTTTLCEQYTGLEAGTQGRAPVYFKGSTWLLLRTKLNEQIKHQFTQDTWLLTIRYPSASKINENPEYHNEGTQYMNTQNRPHLLFVQEGVNRGI